MNLAQAKDAFGLLGWPVAHSHSPAMHNAALAALGIDLRYVAHAVEPERLAEVVRAAAPLGVRGLNVTIPHKEAVLACSEPDVLAREVGAVNTLIYDGGRIRATNTDVHGFTMLLAEAGVDPSGRVVVLGAGGAARAVVAALRPRARALTLVSRSARGVRVGGADVEVVPWEPAALARLLAGADLLVDATPRGLDPALAPLDLAPLPAHAAVVDLVVRRETTLLAEARARGLRAASGEAMLLHQGARSLELWTGRSAPLEIMRAALGDALA